MCLTKKLDMNRYGYVGQSGCRVGICVLLDIYKLHLNIQILLLAVFMDFFYNTVILPHNKST
jgi:hypothetical protein